MIIRLLRYMKGYVRISISGYSVERFINLCSVQNIQLWNLQSDHQKYHMNLYIFDFNKLRPIIRKTGVQLHIVKKNGFYFSLKRYRKRKMLILGFFLFCGLIYFYSSLIWNIDFKGNYYHTTDSLLKFLNAQGIHTGMPANQVNCTRIVQWIRTNYDDIVWVSVSKNNSQLFINIKENSEMQKERKESHSTSGKDLVATKAGRIRKIITRTGIPQIHEGDQVKAGDILVLGKVPVKNDNDEIISYQYQHSDADIYAATTYPYKDTLSHQYQEKQYDSKKQYVFYIKTSKYVLQFPHIPAKKGYEKFQTEKRQNLFHSNVFSFIIGKKTFIKYNKITKKYSKYEQKQKLSLHFKEFCGELQKKGVQITSNSVKIHIGVTSSTASGTIYTIEKIAKAVDTKQEDTEERMISE